MRVSSSQMRAAGQRQQPGDAVQRRRLAAAGRPEQRDELAALDRQRQLVQRVERVAAGAGEAARDAVETQFVEIVLHGQADTTPRQAAAAQSMSQVRRVESPARADVRTRRSFRREECRKRVTAQRDAMTLLRLLRADLLVPDAERLDLRLRLRATACAGTRFSHCSYSGRPYSLIASWLSFGAIDSGTSFTAGPG